MEFTPKSVNLYSKSLHQVRFRSNCSMSNLTPILIFNDIILKQVSGVQAFYPLEVQINHEDQNGHRVTLVILYDYLGDHQSAHFIEQLGIPDINANSDMWELDDLQLDLADMVGNVCSYFTYYGCPTEMEDQDCKMEEMVLFVVLTDIHHITEE